MSQIKSQYDEVRIPFAKMTFAPDVPATALGPNEYNAGINVETDVRGIRSVAGDEAILATVPGTPTYVTAGFRRNGEFWFIVATTEGYWWASNGGAWQDITPGGVPFTGYAQNTNITEAWNGTVPIFNDSLNPPMFLPDEAGATLVVYSNNIKPITITGATYINPTTYRLTFKTTQASAPYVAGNKIIITDVDTYWNGIYTVVTSTTTYVDILIVPGGAYPGGTEGTVNPQYTWNYNPNWKGYYANFLRLYSTPNVGSILVAGNLTVTDVNDITTNYPTTVQWSQAFGLDQAPSTWAPTVTNVANQLEVPLRGPALDGFPCNGQFFLCSYWDTVVFSPMNYSTTAAPILGVRLYNQGRGLLSSNCWANTDKMVYGVDARDVWVFDGNDFTGIGNQRVKNWFFDQLDPQYYDRVFMECNTQKNQVEIYYPDSDAVGGVPNKMISYRYDLDCWNAPRDIASATFACESPIWNNVSGWQPLLGSRTIVYARGVANVALLQKDQGYSFVTSNTNPNGNIVSAFRRDNIKMQQNYSGLTMVHRIMPEVVNLTDTDIPIDPADPAQSSLKGNVTITIEGANSVASAPTVKTPVTIPVDANGNSNATNPWTQINQNSFRVNNIEISNASNSSVWMCNATTWQYTETEDDR